MAHKDSFYNGTAFSNQVYFYGKNNNRRNPRYFFVKRMSVLSIFSVTAYDILRFSTISEIKKYIHIKHNYLSATCLFTRQMIHCEKSNWFSIVPRRHASWPFPRRDTYPVTLLYGILILETFTFCIYENENEYMYITTTAFVMEAVLKWNREANIYSCSSIPTSQSERIMIG